MNTELLAVLEHMEREKGVSREILIEAIESALASAAKKVLHDPEAEVVAKVDPETGDMEVFAGGKKIKSSEFGRIAAQTAKQVIIQKIRDAERDVIYEEYEPRVNSIVSGSVFRYDKGTVILDLGKTEAILPKREQSPRDAYRQGDRVRVYILEVTKGIKGLQIVVSRTHDGFVRKLFEMEVPEVLDSIVEIKGVAREPGDRAKVAVWSKDEKVDCVGACVGMRGSRVKNIVRELQGEKLDIVRWNENAIEYVRAALSPAECISITPDLEEENKILVVVEDDQLSLAIGKSGQNVRLAAKLTGKDIDIKSKSDLEKKDEDVEAEEAEEAADMESEGAPVSEKDQAEVDVQPDVSSEAEPEVVPEVDVPKESEPSAPEAAEREESSKEAISEEVEESKNDGKKEKDSSEEDDKEKDVTG